jgi:hypothetical protein
MQLDRFLPDYDVNEVHSVEIGAAPEAAMAALRGLTPRQVPLTVSLMALRSIRAL